jgi:hypothetical protein
MNLKNWLPEKRIETQLAPQYHYDIYENAMKDWEYKKQLKQNKWEKEYIKNIGPRFIK